METAPAHQPIRVYADQNFLIYCVQNAEWRNAVSEAHRSRRIIVVLSPWHFWECGKGAHHCDTEDLLKFAEELQPAWIPERADLQMIEFWVVWEQLWSSSNEEFDPIGTFTEIVAILNKVDEPQVEGITLRDYVEEFAQSHSTAKIEAVLERQRRVADFNRAQYLKGRMDEVFKAELELKHLASVRARLETKSSNPEIVYRRANELLKEQPIATQLICFIEWGFAHELKCYQTEGALTDDLYATGGTLNTQRFVDRQHASAALPYCDLFVTDDKELKRRCARASARLRFKTARVVCGEELIGSL